MKSTQENFRKLAYRDRQYQFDYIAFSKLLAKKADETKDTGKNQRISQSEWMNRIAYALGVSFEAVKNWKRGNNGPKDIDSVICSAEVLGVDALSLLKPLDENQEDRNLNEAEKTLITEVFSECINAVYDYSNYLINHLTDNRPSNQLVYRDAREILRDVVKNLHLSVDKSSLFISESIRYRLHRLLNDFIDFYESYLMLPERWEEFDSVISNMIPDYPELYSSHDKREKWTNDIWYLSDERELAEKMNYAYTPIPEQYYDNADIDGTVYDENDEPILLEGFEITDDTDFAINPQILYKDMMTRSLKEVFMHDFPELQMLNGGSGK